MINNVKLVYACTAWNSPISNETAMEAAKLLGLEKYQVPKNDTIFICQLQADEEKLISIDYQGIMLYVRRGKIIITNPQDARNILYNDLDRVNAIQYQECRNCADLAGEEIEQYYQVKPRVEDRFQNFLKND